MLSALPAALAMSLMGYGGFPARAGESIITLEKTIESDTPVLDRSDIFPDTYTKGDVEYKFLNMNMEVLESKPEQEEVTVITEQPYYDDDTEQEILPPETIVQDGVTYYLKKSDVINATAEERSIHGKSDIQYTAVEYIDEIPATGEVIVFDQLTGNRYTKVMPRSNYQIDREYWLDDFSFPVTIYSCDADTYMLGSLEIPKDADLTQYDQGFLNLLGLDADYYQIHSISLTGEPYELNEELVRDAMAYGSRKVVDVTATYNGTVTLDAVPAKHYNCTYTSLPPEEEVKMVYSIKATATYGAEPDQPEELPEQSVSFWKQIIHMILNPITITVLLILFFIIMYLLLIKRKNKKE